MPSGTPLQQIAAKKHTTLFNSANPETIDRRPWLPSESLTSKYHEAQVDCPFFEKGA